MPSSTQKHCFYIMHIYGEEARGKIPIKSLPWEFRKAGLRPSASSVYIFYLRNVTSEKEHHFFFQKHIKVGLHSQGKRFPLISCDMILQTQLSSSYRLARGFPKWGEWIKDICQRTKAWAAPCCHFYQREEEKSTLRVFCTGQLLWKLWQRLFFFYRTWNLILNM